MLTTAVASSVDDRSSYSCSFGVLLFLQIPNDTQSIIIFIEGPWQSAQILSSARALHT
jgi:hypothetical protein